MSVLWATQQQCLRSRYLSFFCLCSKCGVFELCSAVKVKVKRLRKVKVVLLVRNEEQGRWIKIAWVIYSVSWSVNRLYRNRCCQYHMKFPSITLRKLYHNFNTFMPDIAMMINFKQIKPLLKNCAKSRKLVSWIL